MRRRTGGEVSIECLVVMTLKRVTPGAECVHQTRRIGHTLRAVCFGGHTVPIGTTWPRYSRPTRLKALGLVVPFQGRPDGALLRASPGPN